MSKRPDGRVTGAIGKQGGTQGIYDTSGRDYGVIGVTFGTLIVLR